jgi:hypothetical protein
MTSAFAIGAAMNTACAATPETAVIVDSGSTNTSGYRIEMRSDGKASLTLQGRHGMGTPSPAKAFTVDSALTARFFNNLKAAHTANVTGSPCMKSASFGTTTHVMWHDWKSPDLDCPSENALLSALIGDVNAIRQASGVGTLPGLGGHVPQSGPPHVEATPSPESSP